MLRLTLRSGIDGRFLARVVESSGRPFVLDFGDTRVIEDLVQRISRGFTVIRAERLVHVHPEDDDLLEKLAGFYAGEGALVFLEEPTWPGRQPEEPALAAAAPEAVELADFDEDDEPTEMVAYGDLPSVDEAMTTLYPDEDITGPPMPYRPPPLPRAEPGPPTDDEDPPALLPGAPDLDRR